MNHLFKIRHLKQGRNLYVKKYITTINKFLNLLYYNKRV